jgi:small subunit ribosomal protein S9
MTANNYFFGLGRRKSSTAQIRLTSGKGGFVVNNKPASDYFSGSQHLLKQLEKPFSALELATDKYDISVKAHGGGHASQVDAINLGVSKALTELNPDYKATLKRAGLLGRDPRERERKKAGFLGARKKRQYTKR